MGFIVTEVTLSGRDRSEKDLKHHSGTEELRTEQKLTAKNTRFLWRRYMKNYSQWFREEEHDVQNTFSFLFCATIVHFWITRILRGLL